MTTLIITDTDTACMMTYTSKPYKLGSLVKLDTCDTTYQIIKAINTSTYLLKKYNDCNDDRNSAESITHKQRPIYIPCVTVL